ncbi:TonB-dependent receptor [Bacteroides sp. 51]|uniref:TonB-dependent receptor n=1 Tax=Bacteroides sp. 51 TaxID=2302938 RepID=UPI0013D0A328|nr:TonB-dependent receptor [Bacteroides sp. 51]NDV81786.1 TonB-dependent receptor [Bacteroides sp. 51]
MHTRILPVMLLFVFVLPVAGQQADSIRTVTLESVTVTADSYKKASNRNSVLSVEVAEKDFLTEHFTGNLIQALEYIPGVRSMDIGSGFSKPMIRGMGFNRIAVTENGIKQEGQQWGSDHGLEIDAFNIERVTVRKGPSSLLYGSDAMGGVIEITSPPAPAGNQFFGEVSLLGKTVNNSLGASLMLGIKKDNWYTKVRYSEQHFGDYRIPADTIVYLTQRIPVYGRRLKNTAGWERNVSLYTEYRKGKYYSNYAISNAYQKTGFFPGAHGIPDISRVQDDGDHRNVEFPYSKVNHLKVTTRQQYSWHNLIGSWDLGYQNNHREEWSKFHTHYGTQSPPEHNPDEELDFALNTFSSSMKLRFIPSTTWEHTAGWDMQFQQNRIAGYSFLLPRYDRFTTGFFALSTWRPSPQLSVSGGLRYDLGSVDISAYTDPYLETYLQGMGYDDELIQQYKWRSYPVDRDFGDFSGSLGISWNPAGAHWVKANIGHSFRLPGANELAANGVHHGTFRHEQGDPSLSSERGWQLDASYIYDTKGFSLSATTFFSWFNNYIYLKPTGEWSVLPHAGQIYRYTGAEAIFAGAELSFDVDFLNHFNYAFMGEYVYTHNQDESTPLAFSPPASMRNTLTWKGKKSQVFAELQSIAKQTRVAKNESVTDGANLVNLGGSLNLPLGGLNVDITLSLRNLFDTKYYNHLSFYRKVEIPEPGRNIQLLIKIPFNTPLK